MTAGTTVSIAVPSAALGEPIACTVYLPPGYGRHGGTRYPVLYLLHGRGDSRRSFDRAVAALDDLIGRGGMPPLIAVAPDAPWSARASWYVDSAYTGAEADGGGRARTGRPVETALVRDLVPAVDATYRTIPTRDGRLIGGYSMGGAGALRLALAYQRLFACALVLSPAVYVPLPPAGSNTRVYGAYGSGARAFDEDMYRRLNYPALLPSVDPALPLHLFIAVGQGDYSDPASRHDIGSQHEALYEAARLTPGIHARARVFAGGHDWDTWLPALVEGAVEGLTVLRLPQNAVAARPARQPAPAQPSPPAQSRPAQFGPAHVPAPPDPGATAPSKDTP